MKHNPITSLVIKINKDLKIELFFLKTQVYEFFKKFLEIRKNIDCEKILNWDHSSLVEHFVDIEGVASSILAGPTKN